MATANDDWMLPEPCEPTVEQPKSCLKPALQPTRIKQVEPSISWCHALFSGKRRNRKHLSQLAESTRSLESQNSECCKVISDLNNGLAVFRDYLMNITKPHDSPEMRERLRDTRKKCLDLCVSAHAIIMPQIKKDLAEGILIDSQHLVNLVCCTQLFLRELKKSYRMISKNPMEMAAYYEKRPRSSGVAVLDRLVLFKVPPRDYHQEELQSILRDSDEIHSLLKEMKEFMPCESNDKLLVDENILKWSKISKKTACKFAEDWICHCGTNL